MPPDERPKSLKPDNDDDGDGDSDSDSDAAAAANEAGPDHTQPDRSDSVMGKSYDLSTMVWRGSRSAD